MSVEKKQLSWLELVKQSGDLRVDATGRFKFRLTLSTANNQAAVNSRNPVEFRVAQMLGMKAVLPTNK
jgi:hypothetical protein